MRTPAYLYFTQDEYRERLDAVQARMRERGIDALVLTTPENICYLSGYQTPGYYYFMALVAPADRDPVLIPPPHEESLVGAFSWVEDYRIHPDTVSGAQATCDVLAELGLDGGTIGVEHGSWFLTNANYRELRERLPSARLVDCSGLVEQGRMIKSPAEVAYMRRAAAAAEAGTRAGIEAARAGATERELAVAVSRAQLLAGSEYTGLPAFITSGERSMMVHATWSERVLRDGDVVFFEVPGCVNRYHAAMSRAAFIGDPPDLLARGSEVNTDALRLAKAAIRPGAVVSEAFEAARERIDSADVPYTQGRRVAYGIGLAFPPGWDEGHIISINRDEHRAFQPGMTFHVITTMRLPGLGAIGCSDTVLVTDRGCETLTGGVEQKAHAR